MIWFCSCFLKLYFFLALRFFSPIFSLSFELLFNTESRLCDARADDRMNIVRWNTFHFIPQFASSLCLRVWERNNFPTQLATTCFFHWQLLLSLPLSIAPTVSMLSNASRFEDAVERRTSRTEMLDEKRSVFVLASSWAPNVCIIISYAWSWIILRRFCDNAAWSIDGSHNFMGNDRRQEKCDALSVTLSAGVYELFKNHRHFYIRMPWHRRDLRPRNVPQFERLLFGRI